MTPERTRRPPRSDALKSFQAAISEINHFYWITRAGAYVLKRSKSTRGAKTAKISLPSKISRHLKIPPSGWASIIDKQELRLLQFCLVDAIAHYEAFLERIVQATLQARPLPTDKSPRIQVPFSEVSSAENAKDFIHRLWTRHKTAEVLSKNYKERPREVGKALDISINEGNSEHELDLDMLLSAQLFRNCIVHSQGIVDGRTVEDMKGLSVAVIEGQPLPLDERLFFRMLKSLLAHAQDIDLLLRVRSSSSSET